MESFEFYISAFVSNAEGVTYEKAVTYAEIRRVSELFSKEEELSSVLAHSFSDRISEIASYLDDERARVRRSVAYLLLGKMDAPNEIYEKAIHVLEEYALNAKGDETLMARGFLLALESSRGTRTTAADDVSLMSSLKSKYIQG
jgi:hypothetical protein